GRDRAVAARGTPAGVGWGLRGGAAHNSPVLSAPAKPRGPMVAKTPNEPASALANAEVRKNLIEQGLEPYPDSTPDKTRHFVEEDIARWTPVIRAIGLKLN